MVTDLRAGSLNFPVFHFDNMAAQTKRAAARHPGYYVSQQPVAQCARMGVTLKFFVV